VVLTPVAWDLWTRYTRVSWILSQKKVLLEIKLPIETFKSPAAMELVLNSLIQTGGEGTPVDRYWYGKARPWCSLELVSIGGDVRFYLWAFESQKNFLMASIYAQYPDIAMHEVEDYTLEVVRNPDKYDFFTSEYKFIKPDAYPIKTYVDYGLSDDPDEEFKVDPLTPLIELLGSIKKEDQIWYQFIARAHVQEKTPWNSKHPDKWVDDAKAEIKKIIDETAVENKDGIKVPNLTKLTEGNKEIIKALERSISKFGLDVGIRSINVIPKGRGGLSVGILKGGFRQFGSNNLNGIAPSAAEFDYDWQDRSGKIVRHWQLNMLKYYHERSYFHPPYYAPEKLGALVKIPILSHFFPHTEKQKAMILNTEELATLYHFPGSTVRTPNLKRIPSKRAEAPSNLPI